MLSPEHGANMRRREFITLIGSAVVVWSFTARAQQTNKASLIGYLRHLLTFPGGACLRRIPAEAP